MTSLRVVDWFSGIGGFHRAFSLAGHRVVGACEINPFCRRVYERRFGPQPWFPRDINEVQPDAIPEADLWVAGSPCQGFSHAGLGLGFDDPRSGLLRRLLFLLAHRRPRWFLLENVPGILTANEGQDFGELMATLDWLGYVGCWATLDARFFGVAQRRRRVFLVAGLGIGTDPRPLLFEPQGVPWNPTPRRASQEDIAGALTQRAGSSGPDAVDALTGHLITSSGRAAYGRNNSSGPIATAGALTAHHSHRLDFETNTFVLEPVPLLEVSKRQGRSASVKDGTGIGRPGDPMFTLQAGAQHGVVIFDPPICVTGQQAHTLTAHGFDASEDGTGRGTPIVTVSVPRPVPHDAAIGFHMTQDPISGTRSPCLDRSSSIGVLDTTSLVRRLTPTECERLQGFSDGWTCLCGVQPYSTVGCTCSDGPRYQSCGNSVAGPVAYWIAANFARYG